MGMFITTCPNERQTLGDRTSDIMCFYRNIGVLQTTVAEMITVKEHQRESETASSSLIRDPMAHTDI